MWRSETVVSLLLRLLIAMLLAGALVVAIKAGRTVDAAIIAILLVPALVLLAGVVRRG